MQLIIDLGRFRALSERFHGFDLQRRRDWIEPWRARIVTTKNERANYRLEAYGPTAADACTRLELLVNEQDEEMREWVKERMPDINGKLPKGESAEKA